MKPFDAENETREEFLDRMFATLGPVSYATIKKYCGSFGSFMWHPFILLSRDDRATYYGWVDVRALPEWCVVAVDDFGSYWQAMDIRIMPFSFKKINFKNGRYWNYQGKSYITKTPLVKAMKSYLSENAKEN